MTTIIVGLAATTEGSTVVPTVAADGKDNHIGVEGYQL